jgi:NTE family protein
MFNLIRKFIFSIFLILFCITVAAGVNNSDRPHIGLVLSGGGAKGLAHIGVLKVIEKAGLPIDIVAGTSIGGIVGGLYACGYTASDLEKMALTQNWMYLLTDQFQRKNLSVKEKEDYDKYMISFPVQDWKIKLPSGFGAGQNVSQLLSKMALPVAYIDDFQQLPRPFVCIATDIVTGDEVVLDHGYLPDAIRASMAIPTFFTPVEIEGHLLVDGGLVNNFPVDRVIERGADIVIGVNLGTKEYTKDELKNMATVLEQAIFFQSKDRKNNSNELCNILISPDVFPYNAGSFTNAAELIKIGEESAMQQFDELKALADSLRNIYQFNSIPKVKTVDSIKIESLQFEGLNNVPASVLRSRLRLNVPGKIAVTDMNEAIERAYGTQFFEKITYKLQKGKNAEILIIRVIEKSNDLLRFSARYDSQYKTQLLLNLTLRNKLIKGSKFIVDFHLGDSPRFLAEYRINTGWRYPEALQILNRKNLGWFPDLGILFDSRTYDVYRYNNSDIVATYRYSYLTSSFFASTTITNALYFETGARYEITHLSAVVSTEEQKVSHDFFKFYGLLKQDTYNNYSFPNRGSLVIASIESIVDPGSKIYHYKPIFRWLLKAEKTVSAGDKLIFIPRINTGMVYGDSIPNDQFLYIGGSYKFNDDRGNAFQFHGLRFMQEYAEAAMVVGLKVQYQLVKDHYIMLEGNAGRAASRWEDIFMDEENKILTGQGIGYGYNSLIGPIEVGVYTSEISNWKWIVFFSLGYWF